MKQILLLLILSTLDIACCMAKIKVVERSAKKMPMWVNTTQTNYIITSAITEDIEKAKNECMDNVRKYIIDAVAQNVQAFSKSSIKQESVNEGITQFLDKYSYTSQTQSANIPYLTGISASKVEDFYWEKRLDTKTDEISYLYCIKYPFPALELKKLISAFKKYDEEMNAKLVALENDYVEIKSVEQINNAVSNLGLLENYFFDKVRKNTASTLRQNYRQLYEQIGIREVSNEPGACILALTLRGNDIQVSQRPALKSETLAQLQAVQDSVSWKIFYDYSTCDSDEENVATVSFHIGGRVLRHQFFVDVDQDKIQMFPCKEVYLTAVCQDSLLTSIVMRMNLNVGQMKPLKIYSITLVVPGLDKPIIIEKIFPINSKGMQTIETTIPVNIVVLESQYGRRNLLKGHLEVLDGKNNIHRVDFSLPFKANW